MNLRRATPQDWPEIRDLRLSVRENRLSDPTRVTQQMYDSYITNGGRGWVAQIRGTIAGFSIARHNGEIWALFIRPGYEGRGLGQALLGAGVAWLAAEGVTQAVLETDAGTRAEAFYRRFGWRETGRSGTVLTFQLDLAKGGAINR